MKVLVVPEGEGGIVGTREKGHVTREREREQNLTE